MWNGTRASTADRYERGSMVSATGSAREGVRRILKSSGRDRCLGCGERASGTHARGEGEAGAEALGRQFGEGFLQAFRGVAARKVLHHVLHRDASSRKARLAGAHARRDNDALAPVHTLFYARAVQSTYGSEGLACRGVSGLRDA